MKKTIITLLLLLTFCVCFVGCGNKEDSRQPDTTSASLSDVELNENESTSSSAWIMATEVDEFGDVIEDSDNVILKSFASGSFSNTATSNGDLRVEIVETLQDNHVFYFKLYEYNKTIATYLSSSKISMKTKIADQITEYTLAGLAPNSPVFLGVNNTDGNQLFNELFSGYDVRCIITIDNSQYNFTILSAGFKELCGDAQERLDEINEKNRIKDIASLVNNILISPDGSVKLREAYQYLQDTREDYTIMSDTDIKQEIDGDFYYVSLTDSNGVLLTYRYVMNYKGNEETQKLYFEDGVDTETPLQQNIVSKFIYENGIIDGYKPFQLRKMADGYYVGFASDGTDYTIPRIVLLKGHQDTTGFVCDYPLPSN